ncbi:MAG: hypothetical protein ACMZ63_01360 [Methylotenera sp.]
MKLKLVFITKAFALSLVFHNFVQANPTGMSPEQMQQMMKQAEAAQACMEKVDQSKLEALEVKGKKMQAEIQALCKAGKRDKAMTTAMEYSMQMKNDPALKEMSKCGEMMQGMMPKPYSPIQEGPDGKPSHVCDNI